MMYLEVWILYDVWLRVYGDRGVKEWGVGGRRGDILIWVFMCTYCGICCKYICCIVYSTALLCMSSVLCVWL
ncbi:hypothetical protein EON63_24695 [archaeon]|nr:MAG: hypothetical protein EON63_24695 [archaeon]